MSFSVGLALAGCVAEQPDADPAVDPLGPLYDARAADYSTWVGPPGFEDRQRARGPHGAFVQVLVSPVLAAALDADAPLTAWPDESTAICEGFSAADAATPEVVSLARKRGGAWSWLQVGPDDALVVAGDVEVCSSCHRAADDSLFSPVLPGARR